MPAFLIHQPACVFIHNPKTGGQALRHVLLALDHEGPVTGALPTDWKQHYAFAFVRNPYDRLVSAWKMFTQGIADTGWKVPKDLKAGIELGEFLEIVMDETIGYGNQDRSGKRRVRNHTLPQSHDYYALSEANFLGRFENYESDTQKIFQHIGLAEPPPQPRHVTQRGPYQQYFDERTRKRATEYYAVDLERFQYQF